MFRTRKRMKGQRPRHFPAARARVVTTVHVPVGAPETPEFVYRNDLGPWVEGLGAHGHQCWKRQPCLWLSLSRGSASPFPEGKREGRRGPPWFLPFLSFQQLAVHHLREITGIKTIRFPPFDGK